MNNNRKTAFSDQPLRLYVSLAIKKQLSPADHHHKLNLTKRWMAAYTEINNACDQRRHSEVHLSCLKVIYEVMVKCTRRPMLLLWSFPEETAVERWKLLVCFQLPFPREIQRLVASFLYPSIDHRSLLAILAQQRTKLDQYISMDNNSTLYWYMERGRAWNGTYLRHPAKDFIQLCVDEPERALSVVNSEELSAAAALAAATTEIRIDPDLFSHWHPTVDEQNLVERRLQ